jgi:hypothetical protein
MAFMFLTLIIGACKKSSTNKKEENFMDGFLATTKYNLRETPYVNATNNECGIEFKPLVNGKITSLQIKLPDVNSALKVTLWDKATSSVIKTETVNINQANTLISIDIADIDLQANKEYAFSMNSADYYGRFETNSANAIYPVVVGNISILRTVTKLSSTVAYPTFNQTNVYYGDCSFKFLPTN